MCREVLPYHPECSDTEGLNCPGEKLGESALIHVTGSGNTEVHGGSVNQKVSIDFESEE